MPRSLSLNAALLALRLGALLALLGLVLGPPVWAQAEAPESIAQAYVDALQAEDTDAATALMAPEDLAYMKAVYVRVLADEGIVGEVYGGSIRMALEVEKAHEVDALSPEALYGGYLSLAAEALLLMRWDVVVVGSVPEDADLVHVLTRATSAEDGVVREAMDVLTLRRGADGWRVRLPVAARSELAMWEASLDRDEAGAGSY